MDFVKSTIVRILNRFENTRQYRQRDKFKNIRANVVAPRLPEMGDGRRGPWVKTQG
ncbi:MAG: hypothetical protein R3C03_07370 [Pirellulaceae bacterium]